MKKLFKILATTLLLTAPLFAYAQLNGIQGGTGVVGISPTFIPYGSASLLRLATSSTLFFTTALSRITFTNASSTYLTAATASTTNLIVSSAGSTGTKCLQVAADGTVSSAASACASTAGFLSSYDAFPRQTTFNTAMSATSSKVFFSGGLFASSTLALPNWFDNIMTVNATSTNATTSELAITGTAINCNTASALTTSSTGRVTCTAQPQGTVTSVIAGTGLNGGTITNTGTLSLISYLATSSAETNTYVPFWVSTAGTPAQLSGGNSTFFFTTAANRLNFTFASSTALSATNLNLSGDASTTNLYATFVGIATTSPATQFTVATGTAFIAEYTKGAATSTSMTINWSNGNQQLVKIGTAGVTFTFTKYSVGQTLRLITCAPDAGTMGTLTFPAGIRWAGGTVPSQTTTAQHCDVYSFLDTQGTSTTAKADFIFGTQSTNF